MKIRVKNIFEPRKTPILAIFDPKRSFLRKYGWSKKIFFLETESTSKNTLVTLIKMRINLKIKFSEFFHTLGRKM